MCRSHGLVSAITFFANPAETDDGRAGCVGFAEPAATARRPKLRMVTTKPEEEKKEKKLC
jgi:hypothetical protein